VKRILVFVCMVLFLGSFVSAEYAAADRFVNNGNCTVTDTQTGLMWADKDSGSGLDWPNAKSYCEGYSGGGKSGWRMPTVVELEGLYNAGIRWGSGAIKLTYDRVWSSETFTPRYSKPSAALYVFALGGYRGSSEQLRWPYKIHALPVRSGN